MNYNKYKTLAISKPNDHILLIEMNRPNKLNAMSKLYWHEMVELFNEIDNDNTIRVVLISGRGRAFTAGLDVMDHADSGLFGENKDKDTARSAFELYKNIRKYQNSFTLINKCHQPVIACIHGACVGGGIDLITACDIRLCTDDAFFCVAEIDIGMAADVGTLQRLPKIVANDSLVRELVYTGRRMYSKEAKEVGLVSHIYSDHNKLMEEALKMAKNIADKSPIAVTGSKVALNYSRDHSVDESLDQILMWNMSMLQTEDIPKAVQAKFQKQKVIHSNL